jgi:DNA segregation ATPase FtsK/SpoIIIE-like protein
MRVLFARIRKKKQAKQNVSGRITLREIFSGRRRNEIKAIAWWALSLLLLVAIWPHSAGQNALGPSGEIMFRIGFALMGVLIYLLPAGTLVYGFLVFKASRIERAPFKMLGLILAVLALGILVELIHARTIHLAMVKQFYTWEGAGVFWKSLPKIFRVWGEISIPAGGLIADRLESLTVTVFSTVGAYIICGTILVISLYLLEAEPYLVKVLRRGIGYMRDVMKKTRQASRSQFDYAGRRKSCSSPDTNRASSSSPVRAGRLSPGSEQADSRTEERPPIKIRAAKAEADMSNFLSVEKTDSCCRENKNYSLPGLEMLNAPQENSAISDEYFQNMSRTLEQALSQFGVEARVVEVCPGPVVTRYELQPSPGVKVNRIISLGDDIALAMRAEHVRIEAPIPGKGAVGIEIPNQQKQVVVLKEMLAIEGFTASDSILTFAVGKDIGGRQILAQLESMPHLLIAGATGSGKSACINAIISSLLYRATPEQVKFLMIDPKRVELTNYNGIPHLKSPVITDSREAAMALKLLVREMEERYKLFAAMGVRSIVDYNRQVAAEAAERQTMEPEECAALGPAPSHMPYIIVFIDELADLMLVSANEVESTITRLAQMARGVGIHMVLATQRPSVDVITGVIKANFPSRIAFQVSSKVDSRTILDANGADALLGRGDMLYAPASAGKPLRVQGVFVTTAEVDRIADFWRKQGTPVFDPEFSSARLKTGSIGLEGGATEDDLYEQAVAWVVRAKQASTSMLQRRLKVGYSRAARLLDKMEENGVVGPPEGSRPRRVLVQPEEAGIQSGDAREEA